MPHLSDQIIPARFLLTLGHFVALCLVTYTKEHNIYAVYDSPSSSEKQAYLSEMEVRPILDNLCIEHYLNNNNKNYKIVIFQTAMNFAYICFAFDFFGMVSGSTIFMNKVFISCLFLFSFADIKCVFFFYNIKQINLFQIIIHFLGGVCISTFIHDNWGYHYLWWGYVLSLFFFSNIFVVIL